MDDAALVGRVDGPCELLDQLHGRPDGLGPAVQPVLQRSPRHVFESEVGRSVLLTDLEDLDDIGVMQTGDRLGLSLEPLKALRAVPRVDGDHLQGDDPLQLLVLRLIDRSHPAPAQFAQEDVATDDRQPRGLGAGGCRVGCRRRHRRGRPARRPLGHRERAVPSSIGTVRIVGGGRRVGRPGWREAARLGRRWRRGLPPQGVHERWRPAMGAADGRRPNLERLLGFDRLGTSAALEQGDERVEELMECVGQQPGVGEAAGGVGFEAGQADRLEILWHLRIPLRQARRLPDRSTPPPAAAGR